MLPGLIRPSVVMNASTSETAAQSTHMNSASHQCTPGITWPVISLSGWNSNMLSALPIANADVFGHGFPMSSQYMQLAAGCLARSSIGQISEVSCNEKLCKQNFLNALNKDIKTETLASRFHEKHATGVNFPKTENFSSHSSATFNEAMTNCNSALSTQGPLGGTPNMHTCKTYCLQTTSLSLDSTEEDIEVESTSQLSVSNQLSADEETNSSFSNTETTCSPGKPFLKFGVQAILSQVQPTLPLKNSQSPSSHASHVPLITNDIHSPFGVPPFPHMNNQLSLGNRYLPPLGTSFFPWFPPSMRGKNRRGMLRRAVFSDAQRKTLETTFQQQKYIGKPDRKKLATKLGLKDSQVKIWFQNRRMKWRNSKEKQTLTSGIPVSSSSSKADGQEVKTYSGGLEDGASSTPPAQNNTIIASQNIIHAPSEDITLLKLP